MREAGTITRSPRAAGGCDERKKDKNGNDDYDKDKDNRITGEKRETVDYVDRNKRMTAGIRPLLCHRHASTMPDGRAEQKIAL